jgi:hypothetical protein
VSAEDAGAATAAKDAAATHSLKIIRLLPGENSSPNKIRLFALIDASAARGRRSVPLATYGGRSGQARGGWKGPSECAGRGFIGLIAAMYLRAVSRGAGAMSPPISTAALAWQPTQTQQWCAACWLAWAAFSSWQSSP